MTFRLTFQPPLWATLLLLAACTLFASAGFWQLDRKAQKAAMFLEFDRGTSIDPVSGAPSDAEAAGARYQPVTLMGKFDAGHQILLDNIVRNGQSGYLVLTPLRTDDGNVLVNRGWIAADPDRSRLPDVEVSAADREVLGRLDRLPRPGLRLAPEPADPAAPWPRRLLFPSAADIADHLGYPVRNYQVLLDPAAKSGYARDWRPGVSGPDMHLGYAVQWFAFAAAVTVIYLVLNLKQRN